MVSRRARGPHHPGGATLTTEEREELRRLEEGTPVRVTSAEIHPWALTDDAGQVLVQEGSNGLPVVCTYRTRKGAVRAQQRWCGNLTERTQAP